MVWGNESAEPANPVRVVAFDDHPVCAKGLEVTIGAAGPGVCFMGVHDSVAGLTVPEGAVPAEVALLELSLRDGSRPGDNVRRLIENGHAVLVYTDLCDARPLVEALDAGASGVVCTYHSASVLLEGIARVHRGERFIPDDVGRMLADSAAHRPRLSAREVEVLNLLNQGLITKQAARRLGVSESTVKEHLKRIRQKYGMLSRPVSTRVQLLRIAQKDGFIHADFLADEQ
jgi:DNA-binding NarL/FixJ family response regulator